MILDVRRCLCCKRFQIKEHGEQADWSGWLDGCGVDVIYQNHEVVSTTTVDNC